MMSLLTLLFVCIYTAQAEIDPCTDSSVHVKDEPARRVGHKDLSATNLLCDYDLQPGWYKFHNAEIPFNKCIHQYECGTHVPLWIHGKYPAVSDNTVTLNVCGDMDESDNTCCDYNSTVLVKNCGNHLVYYLQPLPGCSMSYCTDVSPMCTGSKYSASGFPPCKDAYPIMTSPPHLSDPVVLTDDFEFRCTINYPTSDTDATFIVTWLADGHVMPKYTNTLTGNVRETTLPGEALEEHMNSTLTCAVTSYFTDNHTGGLKSSALPSNGYWVGVEYKETTSSVDQKSPSTMLTLGSTIPVVCRQPGQTDCKLTFAITTDSGNISPSTCTVSLRPTDWNNSTHSAQTSFTVSLLPNIPVTPTGPSHVMTTPVVQPGKEWNNLTVPAHKVDVTSNKPGAQCRTVGDPHYKTFDSAKHLFTDFRVGRFVMVNQLHGGSFKVQTQTYKPPNKKPSFNCGVAIREGNDVITLSMCDDLSSNPKLEIKNPAMFENHTEIVQDKSGNTYVFKARSGAVVKVIHLKRRSNNMLNIFIDVPGTFMEDTEGLCGYFDGQMNNDYTRQNGHVDPTHGDKSDFVESWRISDGESLFEKAEPLPVLQQSYCTCNGQNSQPQCGQQTISVPNIKEICKDCTNVAPQIPQVTPTSAPLPQLATATTAHVPTTTNIPTAPTQLPSEPVITRIEATQICFTMLSKYPSVVECSNSKDTELTDIADMCIKDIQYTGDRTMWVSALQTLMEGCAFRELVNTSITDKGEFVVTSHAQTCPGACTGNGDCVEGSCVCDSGFVSTDCSFHSTEVPTLDGKNGSIRNCDSRTSDQCYTPVMTGSYFQPDVTECFTVDVHYNAEAQAVEIDTTPHAKPTDFKTSHQVTCQLSPNTQTGTDVALKGYRLAMSNNGGVTMSQQTDSYIIYDSKCLSSSPDNQISVKADTCFIQNTCYTKGEHLIAAGWCEPQVNQFAWTQKQPTTQATTAKSQITHASTTVLPQSSSTKATSLLNKYTAVTSGCTCVTDLTSNDCACCQNWGCPCPTNKHSCFDCEDLAMCNV